MMGASVLLLLLLLGLDYNVLYNEWMGWSGRIYTHLVRHSTALDRRSHGHPLVCKRSWVLLHLSIFVAMSCSRENCYFCIHLAISPSGWLPSCHHTLAAAHESQADGSIWVLKSLVVFLPDTMYCGLFSFSGCSSVAYGPLTPSALTRSPLC